MQMLEDGCQKLREQLLLRHDLTLHEHYLRQGPISVTLLAALRLAVGDEQYLRAVEQRVCSPLQVRRLATLLPPSGKGFQYCADSLKATAARDNHAAVTTS